MAELAGDRRGGAGLVNARRDQGTWSFWADVVRNLFGFFRVVRDEFRTRRGRLLVKLIPMLWLGLFFAVPFLIVARISFAEAVVGRDSRVMGRTANSIQLLQAFGVSLLGISRQHLYDILKDTVIDRGDRPLPARQMLELTPPENVLAAMREAAARRREQAKQQDANQ